MDPHRALDLAPGATQAEIKRAYRHLAKQYHPDSAGERALPRFLAIQAAYEALTAGGRVGGPIRPGTREHRSPGPPPSPWQADPGRARATREAWRARTRRSAGPSEPRAPGASGDGGTFGGAETSGDRGTSGGAGDTAGRTRTGSRERRPRKATVGSTSHDGADPEPFDPAWEGATWYGAGSGTYWTINPKEYADPRKHGPEYLARTRCGPDPAPPPSPGAAPPAPRPEPRGIARWLGRLSLWRRPRVR